MKQLFFLILIIISLLFLPVHVHAHLGGGPPFLKINGKDANTNPMNQGSPSLTIPWDHPPESYLVNTPITFVIDVPELMRATTVPVELAKDIKIRWSYATGENFTEKEEKFDEGSTITKTFSKPGSYLVIMEAKLPADSDYIVINTVQVDVLPNDSYELPFASAYIGTQFDDVKKNVFLVSQSSVDSSTTIKKYIWDFGEGKLQEGKSVNRRFEKTESLGVEQVFHRIVDENGFIADVGFVSENQNGKISFNGFNSSNKVPVTVGTYQQAAELAGKTKDKLTIPQFLIAAVGVVILIGAGWWWIIKKHP